MKNHLWLSRMIAVLGLVAFLPLWSPATADTTHLLFSDDFSTDKGWIDESNGYIYRDVTNEWLVWSVTRSQTRRYYVPISASPDFLQLDFRVKQTGAGGNGGTGFSLVESLEGPPPGHFFRASGFQVHVTRDTLWGPRVRMGAKYENGDYVGLTTPGSIPYSSMNVWLDVRLTIDDQVATLTVWDENHNELGQRVLVLPQSHSGYHYFGIIFDAETGWEWATGYLDDIEIWGQPLTQSVDIDIKPGSYPNCFNNDGHGVIPVAILTTDNFDAATVDPFSLALDGTGARVKGKSSRAGSLEDLDNDGDLDLVVQIQDIDGTYQAGDTVATLTGETFDGILVQGQDTICIVP
jgi:hypothetical protein